MYELPRHTNPLPKERKDVINPYKNINAIIIPDNATNGDIIKELFPTIQWDNECNNILYGFKTNDREMPMLGMNMDWMNAPYKRKVEK